MPLVSLPARQIHALTLDLDDTLWPIGPTIANAEAALVEWFDREVPAVTQRFDATARSAVREAVTRDHPELAHDVSALRREAIRRLLAGAGADPSLVDPAFDVFYAARQRVQLYPDVPPALQRLAARWPLLALTNGNADLAQVGLGRWFVGTVSARETGHGKPDRRIFAAACDRLALPPAAVLHVGDDLELDVLAAGAAGLHRAWVRRDPAGGGGAMPVEAWQGPDLLALAEHLGV